MKKFFFDLFPVILFFASFKIAGSRADEAAALAGSLLGGSVSATQAPVLIATAVAILASLVQFGIVFARGRRPEPMLCISLAIILVFGGLTLYLHNEMFIKWKPTILYWVFAAILLGGQVTHRNFIRSLMCSQISMDEAGWSVMQWAWMGFFAAVGVINLAVAYTFTTDTWVNFKLFGLTALTLAFALAAGVFMVKHAKELPQESGKPAPQGLQDKH